MYFELYNLNELSNISERNNAQKFRQVAKYSVSLAKVWIRLKINRGDVFVKFSSNEISISYVNQRQKSFRIWQ